ncbi:MAG: hypothetical protein AAFX62_11765 [Pseudomonadota bacterium]
MPGMTPDMTRLGAACAFAERCPRAAAACATAPGIEEPRAGQEVRCHHPYLEGAQ